MNNKGSRHHTRERRPFLGDVRRFWAAFGRATIVKTALERRLCAPLSSRPMGASWSFAMTWAGGVGVAVGKVESPPFRHSCISVYPAGAGTNPLPRPDLFPASQPQHAAEFLCARSHLSIRVHPVLAQGPQAGDVGRMASPIRQRRGLALSRLLRCCARGYPQVPGRAAHVCGIMEESAMTEFTDVLGRNLTHRRDCGEDTPLPGRVRLTGDLALRRYELEHARQTGNGVLR